MLLTAHSGNLAMRALYGGGALLLGLAATPSTGQACGVTPPSLTLLSSKGRVFASARVLQLYEYGSASAVWEATLRSADLPAVSLAVTPYESNSPLRELLVPAGLLVPGVHYTLEVARSNADQFPPHPPKSFDLDVIEPPHEPETLGELTLETRQRGVFALGGCGGTQPGVQAIVALTPAGWSEAWVQNAQHELWVDGQLFSGEALTMIDYIERARGLRVRVISRCEPVAESAYLDLPQDAHDVPLPAGEHQLIWKSTFPSGLQLSSAPLVVDTRCDVDRVPSDDAPAAQESVAEGHDVEACSLGTHEGRASSAWCGSLLGLAFVVRRRRWATARRQP